MLNVIYLVLLGIGVNMNIEQQFKKGSTDMILLSLINRRKTYGYEIIQTLAGASELFKNVKEGTIYPILYRLEDDGLITNKTEVVNGRKKKIYEITELGKSKLTELVKFWTIFKMDIDELVGECNEQRRVFEKD